MKVRSFTYSLKEGIEVALHALDRQVNDSLGGDRGIKIISIMPDNVLNGLQENVLVRIVLYEDPN